MASILLGKSTCPVCSQLLLKGEETTALPAISKIDHPLYHYFDQGFHQHCFENWDKKEEVLKLVKEEKKKFTDSDYYKEMKDKYGKTK